MYRLILLLIVTSFIFGGCERAPGVETTSGVRHLFDYVEPGLACHDHTNDNVETLAVVQNYSHTLEVFCLTSEGSMFVLEHSSPSQKLTPGKRTLGQFISNNDLEPTETNPPEQTCDKYNMSYMGQIKMGGPVSLGMDSFLGWRYVLVCTNRASRHMLMLQPTETGTPYGSIWRTWRNVRFYPDLPPQE